jgi:hypothetical protein
MTDEAHVPEDNIELLDLTEPKHWHVSLQTTDKTGGQLTTTTGDSSGLRAKGMTTPAQDASQPALTRHSKFLSSPEIHDESSSPGKKLCSSDYSDGFLEDLPSPSAFFAGLVHQSSRLPGEEGEEGSRNVAQSAVSPISNKHLGERSNACLPSTPDHLDDNLKCPDGRNICVGSISPTEKAVCESSLLEPVNSSWKFEDQLALGFSLEPSTNAPAVEPPEQECLKPPKRHAGMVNGTEDSRQNAVKRARYDDVCAERNNQPAATAPGQKTTDKPPCGSNQKGDVTGDDLFAWDGIDPLLFEEFKDIVNFY